MSIIIDADRLWKAITSQYNDSISLKELGELIYDGDMEVWELPFAEWTGEWIPIGDGSLYQCSECGETSCCKGNYCPDCGTRMVSEDDIEAQREYKAAVEQMEHDILYEPAYSQEDGSM